MEAHRDWRGRVRETDGARVSKTAPGELQQLPGAVDRVVLTGDAGKPIPLVYHEASCSNKAVADSLHLGASKQGVNKCEMTVTIYIPPWKLQSSQEVAPQKNSIDMMRMGVGLSYMIHSPMLS